MKINKDFHKTKNGSIKRNPYRPTFSFDRNYWLARKDRRDKLAEYIKIIKERILELAKWLEKADYIVRARFKRDISSRRMYKKDAEKNLKELLMNQRLLEKAEDTYYYGYD